VLNFIAVQNDLDELRESLQAAKSTKDRGGGESSRSRMELDVQRIGFVNAKLEFCIA
jgi:hypothetical protein